MMPRSFSYETQSVKYSCRAPTTQRHQLRAPRKTLSSFVSYCLFAQLPYSERKGTLQGFFWERIRRDGPLPSPRWGARLTNDGAPSERVIRVAVARRLGVRNP